MFKVRKPDLLDRVIGAVQTLARIPQRLEEIAGAARGLKDELRAYRLLRMHGQSIACLACIDRPKDLKADESWSAPYWYPAASPACTRCKAPNPLHERRDGWTNPAR